MSTIAAGTATGTALVSTGDTTGQLVLQTNGTTTAVTIDTSQRMGVGTATPVARLDVSGSQAQNVVAVAALDIDCSQGNYFTKTINGASTFTFSNVPASRAYSFTLELTVTSGSATWPAAVTWPSGTAPTLSTSKTSLLMFVTDDGGARWRGASLVDYTT